MNSQRIDLKSEINAKKEILNSKIDQGNIGEDILKLSRELDLLIVKYMNQEYDN